MKHILIKEENAQKIQSVLDEVQKRSKVRTASVYDVYDMTQKLFDTVKVPKKLLDGISVLCNPNAQNFPSCYRHTPFSTVFRIAVKNGKPYLTDVYRGRCTKNNTDWYIPVELYSTIADSLLFHTTHASHVKTVCFDEYEIRKALEQE